MAYRKLRMIGCTPCREVPAGCCKASFRKAAAACSGIICTAKPAENPAKPGQKPVKINRLANGR